MARYDVFLVNSIADREKAELIARRLRALKFKVRHDKKRTHTEPTPRDLRDSDNASSVLVLWSKNACSEEQGDSEWVYAMAQHAVARDGALVQAGLDKTVPGEPFSGDDRFILTGMGPRKLVNGYYNLVDALGRREGRDGLRDWVTLKASDKDGKAAWKAKYPADPLSVVKSAPVAAPAVIAPAPEPDPEPTRRQAPALSIKPPGPPQSSQIDIGRYMLIAVGVVIAGMLILSAGLQTKAGLPAAGGIPATMVEQCPAGQMPAYLLEQPTRPPLEPGPIIDDTEDEDG